MLLTPIATGLFVIGRDGPDDGIPAVAFGERAAEFKRSRGLPTLPADPQFPAGHVIVEHRATRTIFDPSFGQVQFSGIEAPSYIDGRPA